VIGVQQNAPGGKGPHFDHARGEGKREGMAGTARSSHPGRCPPAGVEASRPSGKCDDFNAGYGLRPGSLQVAGFMPYRTVSTGVTSCGRHGTG
jgi:hypothetical protein